METNFEPQFSSAKVYMKCPSCTNPYSVDPLDISTHQPTFDCLACGTRFFFQWPQPFQDRELTTYAAEAITELAESSSAVEAEPKKNDEKSAEKSAEKSTAASPVALKATESIQPAEPTVRVRVGDEMELALHEKWTALQNHWEDEWWHQSFLSFCDKKSRLSFASGRYAQYLKTHPQDEMARKMRERLKALSRSDLIKAHQVSSSAPSKSLNSSSRTPGVFVRWWWTGSLLTCLTLFMVGYSQPMYQNLVGLSLALAVFTFGVKFLFLSDRSK